MPHVRRYFSPQFKAELVIEVLKGESDIETIAARNDINPGLLRTWKREFLENASVVFESGREDNIREKLLAERKEKAKYARKAEELTRQVDWMKKVSEEALGPDYEDLYDPKPFD